VKLEAFMFDCRDDAVIAFADGFAPQRVALMPVNSLRLPQRVPPQRRIGDGAAKRRAESTRPTAARVFRKAGLIRALGVIVLAVALTSCGGSGSDGGPAAPTGTVTIGPAGGSVAEASGAQVVVPAGALATATPIGVARSSVGAPALPAGVTPVGPIYAFTPHGITFSPAMITVPFDAAQVPAGATPVLFKTDAAQSAWKQVPGATAVGSSISGPANGFSFAVVATLPPTQLLAVRKDWGIAAARDCCDEPEDQDFHSSPDDGEYGSNAKTFAFGAPLALISGPPRADMRAQGSVVFTQDGFIGEASLRRAVVQFMAHYHAERNHQGLGNRLIRAAQPAVLSRRAVERRVRLGGMLSFYRCTVA
jgi:hypothetical protein